MLKDSHHCAAVPQGRKVYYKSFKVVDALEKLTDDDEPPEIRRAGMTAFKKRWEMWHTILHGAAYVFDPEYLDVDMSELREPMQNVDKVIPLLSKNSDDAKEASKQLLNFRDKIGIFGSEVALNCAKEMAGWKWWKRFGYECNELKFVPVRILFQVVSASERNWSAFGQQHTDVRNRLKLDRAKSLTYSYQSLRLHDKF